MRPSLIAFALVLWPTLAVAHERRLHVDQVYEVKSAAGGGEVTLFFPIPSDDPWQTVTGLSVTADSAGAPFELVHDPRYGNAAARLRLPPSGRTVRVSFDVLRRERSADLARATSVAAPSGYRAFLSDDNLVRIDPRVRRIAADVTRQAHTPLDRARAIYAYVLSTMKYEKPPGKEWGRGSIVWACDQKYGNCSDFHALLIGLLRASGIPARFQIGYPVPAGTVGEIAGYHCWADFYLDGVGWVPVDASEGWKNKDKRDYFFGHHDENRFALSLGRDIALPGMKGAPLNYFVYPYAETGAGAPVEVGRKTSWRALP